MDPLISEPEKVILLAEESARRKIRAGLDTETVSPLVYVMKEFTVPFFYEFTFNPFPFSGDLINDIRTLGQAGYLAVDSPIIPQPKAHQYLEKNFDRFQEFSKALSVGIERVASWDSASLLRQAYNLAVSGPRKMTR